MPDFITLKEVREFLEQKYKIFWTVLPKAVAKLDIKVENKSMIFLDFIRLDLYLSDKAVRETLTKVKQCKNLK